MTKSLNKKKLITDFQMMLDFEISARDQYLKMAQDPFIQKAGIQDQFNLIAHEEEKHIKIVGMIIDLIDKKL